MPDQTLTTADIVRRAGEDDAFRTALLADPKAVLQRELGFELPADLTVRVVEQTPTELTLALPPQQTEGDLSDDELSGVAGGGSLFWTNNAPCPLWT